jgi:hypothetical protein
MIQCISEVRLKESNREVDAHQDVFVQDIEEFNVALRSLPSPCGVANKLVVLLNSRGAFQYFRQP